MRKYIAATAAACSLGFAGEAAATAYTFGFEGYRPGGSEEAGRYEGLRFTYDGAALSGPSLDVSGTVRVSDRENPVNGGWFALTPGGDPRATDDQIAIFYMDFVSGRLSSYHYDGTLGTNGWQTFTDESLFITTWSDAITSTINDDLVNFSIDQLDVTAVQQAGQSPTYTGVSFDEYIGIWMHLSAFPEIGFDETGRVTLFRGSSLASFDLPSAPANPVPVPGAVIFAATGLAGFGAVRRRLALKR